MSVNNYLKAEKRLNEFFSLTNYCVENCIPVSKKGCCHYNHFETNVLIHERYDSLNSLRDKIYGIPEQKSDSCDYYEENEGCILKTHKNNFCLSYICEDYKNYLSENFKIKYDDNKLFLFFEKILDDNITQEEFEDFNTKIDDWIKKIKEKKEK